MHGSSPGGLSEVAQLLDARSGAAARRVALEAGLESGPTYLRLARSLVSNGLSSAEAAKFYMFAWHMKRVNFTIEDMITFCKCITDSDVALSDLPVVNSSFLRRMRSSNLSPQKEVELRIRMYGALNDFTERPDFLDGLDLSEGTFPASSEYVRDLAYVLLHAERYDVLDELLDRYATFMPAKDGKDFSLSSQAFRNTEIRIMRDQYGYRASYFKLPEASALVVTFGYSGTGKRSPAYAANFLVSNGFDVLHVAQAEGSGYQYLPEEDVHAVVQEVRAGRPYREVFTYGSSLGGYAALYYAGAADAVAIAGSPRHIMHPSFRTTKYPIFDERHLSMQDVQKTDKPAYILNDPHESMDARGMEMLFLPNLPNARVIDFPGYGHPVTTRMAQNRELKPLVLSILNGNPSMR